MQLIWQTVIANPIFNLLIIFYRLTGNLGVAIIIFTAVVKTILIPVTIPALKMSKKQRDMQPELDKIKEKYKYDKKKQAELQMEILKKHGVNPGTGCLTTIVTIILMIAVYRSVSTLTIHKNIDSINSGIYIQSMKLQPTEVIQTKFLYLDLTKPDPILVFTIFAVILQFLATKMMMPYQKIEENAAKQTPQKTDDIIYSMQQQNLYTMPIMFFIFGLTLPSGVMIYIVVSTLYQIVQTYYFSGWGGLQPWINKIKFAKRKA